MTRSRAPNRPPNDPGVAHAFEQATALHRQGALDEAAALYLSALQAYPDHPEALHGLGLLRAQRGELVEAIALLRKAVDRAPRAAAIHNDLGAALQAAGRHKQAVACHQRAIALEPDDASGHFNLGAALHAMGRLEAALSPYQAALARRPSFAEAAHNLGDALATLGRPADAVLWFERALAIGPESADTHHKLGMALAAYGRHDEAVTRFRRATALRPDLIEAHNNLGGLLHALGRLEEAVDAFTAAAAVNPNSADLHSNCAVVLAALGRHVDAATRCERAIVLQPDLAEAHNNLGSALRALGHHEAALPCFERAVALRPSYAEAFNNLGSLLNSMGRDEAAIPWFERAVAIKPSDPEMLNNLGAALGLVGRQTEALALFDRALALQPEYVGALMNRGVALVRLMRESDAILCFERALAIDPKHAETYQNLGNALLNLGRLDEAQRAVETAIALDPKGIGHYFALAASKRFVPGDPMLKALEDLAQSLDARSEIHQTKLQFALGKAYADLGEHARAFEHLLEGNRLKRRSIVYDEDETLRWFDRIPRTVTPAAMLGLQGLGEPSPVPIFIVGMPRSGTTLVEQILASHADVFGAGELEAFRMAMMQIVGSDKTTINFPELIDTITAAQLRRLGSTYLDHIRAMAPTAARITDKLPLNFSCAGLIHLALPGARIIHVRRDPIDTCLSCFALQFAGHQPYSYELGELGRYYRAYEAVMAHWRTVLPAGVMLEVRYEDVVDDLEGQARRLIAHCGLDWDPACLAFHETDRPVRTASVAQVRQPIYRSSIARWKPYEHLLTPLLEALGSDR